MRRGGLDWSQAALRDDGLPRAGDPCGTGCGSGGRPWRSTLWDGVPQGGAFGPPISAEQLLSRQPRSTLWEGFGEGPPLGPLQSAAEIAAKPARVSIWEGFREGDGRFARELARPPHQDAGARPRQVSGDGLAQLMRLDPETAQRIAGQTVALDAEAWGAVRAAQRARLQLKSERARIARRRAEIWPKAPLPAVATPEGQDACGCVALLNAGLRYVDAELGDDANSGTLVVFRDSGAHSAVLQPWRTLRRVQAWLEDLVAEAAGRCVVGAEVYLRSGRTWDGTEELDGPWERGLPSPWRDRDAALEIRGLRATAAAPLILSAYSTEDEWTTRAGSSWVDPEGVLRGAGSGPRPTLNGTDRTMASPSEEPPYGDERAAILLRDCCHVAVSWLEIRGFGRGIEVRGHSKHHSYQSLALHSLARVGISIVVRDIDTQYYDASVYPGGFTVATAGDRATALANAQNLGVELAAIASAGDYPEHIEISCCSFDSIGYDTVGTDIALGYLATNCTIRLNAMTGDAVRGLDGIVAQGASSGHLIEHNHISNHRKLCNIDTTRHDVRQAYKAVFRSDRLGVLTLAHPCDGEVGSGDPHAVPMEYGYAQRWYDYTRLDLDPTAVAPEGTSAFGEGGIGLKALRAARTPTSEASTHICDNVIWGHPTFAGISVYEGCQGIHIYRNRIYQNGTGIYISNRSNDAWYNDGDPAYYQEKTAEVYVYQNQIYMNELRGVHVVNEVDTIANGPDAGASYEFQIAEIYVYLNTLAHNLWQGVTVRCDGSSYENVDQVQLLGNLIIRNGRWIKEWLGASDQSHQVRWEGLIWLSRPIAWGPRRNAWADYNCYLGWDYDSDWSALNPGEVIFWAPSGSRSVLGAQDWGIEAHSVQAWELEWLDLASVTELQELEGWTEEAGDGVDLQDAVLDPGNADTLRGLDYTTGPRGVCQPMSYASWVQASADARARSPLPGVLPAKGSTPWGDACMRTNP